MNDPLDDDSRWTLLGSRFVTDGPIHKMFNEMFEEWVESLPVDDPARLLHYMLPKPPGYDYGICPCDCFECRVNRHDICRHQIRCIARPIRAEDFYDE